ncbi:GTP cyclohydrolase I FolE2, partial [Verrucomicrobia bacterium]|nr:GTP cyclohydrolase I FolE2 [Verrucomicrobiota bacterium]
MLLLLIIISIAKHYWQQAILQSANDQVCLIKQKLIISAVETSDTKKIEAGKKISKSGALVDTQNQKDERC